MEEHDACDAPQFAAEIESLLKFNCGVGVKDVRCVVVVEQFLHLQLNELINKCIKLCRMRHSDVIQLQDLLFIFVKNELKFARLVKHMIFKDKQHKSKFSAMGDGCQLSEYYGVMNEGMSPAADPGSAGPKNGNNATFGSERAPQPRIASIKQFLDTFIVSEQVTAACFSPQLDKVKKLRLQREERFAALMSPSEYVQWNQAKIPLYVQFRMKVKIYCDQMLVPFSYLNPSKQIFLPAAKDLGHFKTPQIYCFVIVCDPSKHMWFSHDIDFITRRKRH